MWRWTWCCRFAVGIIKTDYVIGGMRALFDYSKPVKRYNSLEIATRVVVHENKETIA